MYETTKYNERKIRDFLSALDGLRTAAKYVRAALLLLLLLLLLACLTALFLCYCRFVSLFRFGS
jgi:hypothetical protein